MAKSYHQFDLRLEKWIGETCDVSYIVFPQSSIESNYEEVSINHLKIDLDVLSDGIAGMLVDHLLDKKISIVLCESINFSVHLG